jgi:hypothetical protein
MNADNELLFEYMRTVHGSDPVRSSRFLPSAFLVIPRPQESTTDEVKGSDPSAIASVRRCVSSALSHFSIHQRSTEPCC